LKLSLVETENKGVGVISTCPLQPGTFVGEYVGEVITTAMAAERLKSLNKSAKCFIIQYHEHISGNVISTNIDATLKGNITRYINHSCDPNLVVVPVRSDSLVPRLCFFACKHVEADEELCFSYFGARDIADESKISMGKKKCYCGSANCIGYLPLNL
jgi:SET domain-containing protein